jgi:hypothetical protein
MGEGDRATTPPLPPREEAEVRLPPPPLATEAVVRVREVPLPWSTPLATLAAGAVASAALAASLHYTEGTPMGEAVLSAATLWWWTGIIGAAVVAADRLLPRWPAPGRWALGMAVAVLVPNPVVAWKMLGGGAMNWGSLMVMGVVAAALFAALGAGLGFARRSSQGLWWRLPLAGALVMAALPGSLVSVGVAVQAFVGGPTSLPGPVLVRIVALAGVLALCGGLIGLALAERLWRAERRGQVK